MSNIFDFRKFIRPARAETTSQSVPAGEFGHSAPPTADPTGFRSLYQAAAIEAAADFMEAQVNVLAALVEGCEKSVLTHEKLAEILHTQEIQTRQFARHLRRCV